jgi:hypothetical protein
MRARVSSTELSFPISKVFSMKANGLERFLTELESGAKESRHNPPELYPTFEMMSKF